MWGKQYGTLESFVSLTGVGAESEVQYACNGATPMISAFEQTNKGTKDIPVESGDRLRTVITSNTGANSGDVSVSLTDLTSGARMKTFSPDTTMATGILIRVLAPDGTIPTFDAIHVSDVRLSGWPLASVPGLQQYVMTGRYGTMVQTTGLTAYGRGFALRFRRNGIN